MIGQEYSQRLQILSFSELCKCRWDIEVWMVTYPRRNFDKYHWFSHEKYEPIKASIQLVRYSKIMCGIDTENDSSSDKYFTGVETRKILATYISRSGLTLGLFASNLSPALLKLKDRCVILIAVWSLQG